MDGVKSEMPIGGSYRLDLPQVPYFPNSNLAPSLIPDTVYCPFLLRCGSVVTSCPSTQEIKELSIMQPFWPTRTHDAAVNKSPTYHSYPLFPFPGSLLWYEHA